MLTESSAYAHRPDPSGRGGGARDGGWREQAAWRQRTRGAAKCQIV